MPQIAALVSNIKGQVDSVTAAPGQGGGSIIFTCHPGGEVFGLCYSLPLTKAQLIADFTMLMTSAPQPIQDQLNAALAIFKAGAF